MAIHLDSGAGPSILRLANGRTGQHNKGAAQRSPAQPTTAWRGQLMQVRRDATYDVGAGRAA
ncbi:hypothetical protein BKA80DRAFT_278765 [Phyllosticta citrichinensis]